MAYTYTGTATIMTSEGTWTGPTGAAYHKLVSGSGTYTRPVTPLRDGGMNTLGFYMPPEGEIALDLEIVIRSDTLANAVVAGVFLTPNTKITLASFVNTNFNGDWHYRDGCAIAVGTDQEIKLNCTVYQYPNCAKTVTQLTTAISS
jgi:hypothetical protein